MFRHLLNTFSTHCFKKKKNSTTAVQVDQAHPMPPHPVEGKEIFTKKSSITAHCWVLYETHNRGSVLSAGVNSKVGINKTYGGQTAGTHMVVALLVHIWWSHCWYTYDGHTAGTHTCTVVTLLVHIHVHHVWWSHFWYTYGGHIAGTHTCMVVTLLVHIHSGSAVQIRVTINSRRQYTRRANSETWVGSHCFLGPYGRYLERGPYDQTVCKDTKYTQ